MKTIIVVLALIPSLVFSSPYLEWKNELKYKNTLHSDTINHLRIGYKFDKVYFELGPRTSGLSAELGYKYNINNRFSIKGKWEANNTDSFKHKLETEFRIKF